MRNILFIFLFLSSIGLHAQEKDSISLDSAEIIYQVGIGNKTGIGDFSVEFIKVIADSRCPRNVACVWAGEAKILMGIYENGEIVEEKKIVIPAKGMNIPLFSGENFLVQVFDLKPYPDVKNPISEKEYFLNLMVEKFSEEGN